MEINENVSLEKFNTFGVDVKTKFFIEIFNENEVISIIERKNLFLEKFLILGSGSNLLFTKDFDGTIIKINNKGIDVIKKNNNIIYLKVAAGEDWDELVNYTLQNNIYGLENLSLIPGKVGSASVQNIGAYGSEFKDFFYSLEAINVISGEKRVFFYNEIKFGYRYSIFKSELKNQFIVMSVTFILSSIPKLNIEYNELKNEIKDINKISPLEIRAIICKIRKEKLPDPYFFPNAGSFFKNPIIDNNKFSSLRLSFPDIRFFTIEDKLYKISAAWMIEQCGWKAKRLGNCGVYEKHALILVNYNNAKGNEILELAKLIKIDVKNKFGILLEYEVVVI